MLKIIIGFLLIAVSCCISASGSTNTDFRFNHLDHDNLLSKVSYISYQDSKGYIWFGTDLGAYRYDGYDVVNYSNSLGNKNDIVNNYVDDIIEFDGSIWIGTEGGISVVTNGKTKHYINGLDGISLLGDWITSFFVYKNELYITTSGGVSKFNKLADNFKPIYKSKEHAFSSYIHNDKIYIGFSNGFFFLNSKKGTITPVIKNFHHTVDVALFEKDGIYLGTESNGLWFFKYSTQKISSIYNRKKTSDPLTEITSIKKYNDLVLFSVFNEGFYSLDTESKKIINVTSENRSITRSIKSNHIYNLMIDNTGVLWVSTNKGVSLYSSLKNGTFLKYGANTMSVNNSISYKDTQYLATEQGVFIYDTITNNFKSNEKFKILNNKKVWDVKIKGDTIWFAIQDGIAKFNINDNKLEYYNNVKYLNTERAIYTITILDTNLVYFTGQKDVGIKLFNSETKTILTDLIKPDSHYLKDYSYAMEAKVVGGNLWLASVTGLYKFNLTTRKETHFTVDPNIKNLRIQDITFDTKGNGWFVTNGSGLYAFKYTDENPTFIKINTAGKNVFDNIIIIDYSIWYTADRSLFQYNLISKTEKTYANIISDADIILNSSSLNYHNGFLNIGTSDGLLTVELDSLKSNDTKPLVTLNNIIVNKHAINKLNGFSLDYNSRVDFNFSSLDFNSIKNVKYKYMLEGVDSKWEVSKKNYATYSNLKQGEYTFKIKSSNSQGVWSSQDLIVKFNVNYAWWSYLLMFLAVLFVIGISTVFRIRQNQIESLNKQANTDNLTGLKNRMFFYQYTKNLIKNKSNHFAVVYIDLDNFKEVNDSMGHSVGDELIIEFSNRLLNFFDKKDIVVRLSGDEFAVVVNYCSKSKLNLIFKNIRENINSKYNLNDKIIKCTSSIGVAIFPEDSDDFENLLINADIAMYASKKKGKNKLSYFSEDMKKDFNEKSEIRKLLSHALQNKEFSINYQPKFCMNTSSVTGFEALIRWNHHEKGYISPAVFIPEAENNGLIIDIGEWVLREACKQAAKWNKEHLLVSNVSVNISAIQLHDDNIINVIIAALNNSNLPANKLELEITETVFVSNINKTIETLKKIRELGVRIALDDFGTGYSSLSYLKSFPINTLKIDRSFIQDLREGNINEIILKNIFNLANDLKFEVVVEGVEHKSELEIIQKYNCDYIQGFYFSPPVNVENATSILTNGLNKNIMKIA